MDGLLLRVTLLFALALLCLPLMRGAAAEIRRIVCACALAGAWLLPLTLISLPEAARIPVPAIAIIAAPQGWAAPALHLPRLLFPLWIAGAMILMTRIALGYWRI